MVALLGSLFEQEAEFRPHANRQRRGLRLILADPQGCCLLVAERRGTVVGMVSLLASVSTALGARVAWLEDLVVAPEQRRRGVGRRLLQAAVAEARRRGWRRVSLLTDADNAASQALYQAQGFIASPMRPYRRKIVPKH
jgi:ribosomal protein S18 acetylase RimI-like enzyme